MKVICREFRPFERNTLQGFADLELPEIGLLIKDATVHRKNGKVWVGLPGRPQLDKGGSLVRDPSTGKAAYVAVLQFTGRASSDTFAAAAFESLRAKFPEALAEQAGAA